MSLLSPYPFFARIEEKLRTLKMGGEIAIRVWDQHLGPEWPGRLFLGLGFGVGGLISAMTFCVALMQGITLLYAALLAFFALIFTVIVVLAIMEATGKRRPKLTRSAIIQPSEVGARIGEAGIKVKIDGAIHVGEVRTREKRAEARRARSLPGKASYKSDGKEFIPLPEAARRVLTSMRTPFLGIKPMGGSIPEQRLNYVGIYISRAKGMRLFGQKVPLDVNEEVEQLDRYRMEGATELYLPGENHPTYAALSVLSSELDSNWEELIASN